MNQVLLGGIALIIAFILLGSKKTLNKSLLFKFQKDSFPDNNPTNSFVQKNKLINRKESENQKNSILKPFSKQPSLSSIEIHRKLTKLICSNPKDRLLAIQIASQWRNKKAIPFLRRGLKDFDIEVVIASAAAISSYKGKTINLKKRSQPSRPPRNVSLMR